MPTGRRYGCDSSGLRSAARDLFGSEELVARGDLAGARVLRRRAAEAHDAQATLALGATYDPTVVQKLGVRGVAADIAIARTWYEKAKEFG